MCRSARNSRRLLVVLAWPGQAKPGQVWHMYLINAAIMRLALPIRSPRSQARELIMRLCLRLIKTQTDRCQGLSHSEIKYHPRK